jgi:hypothetical protein
MRSGRVGPFPADKVDPLLEAGKILGQEVPQREVTARGKLLAQDSMGAGAALPGNLKGQMFRLFKPCQTLKGSEIAV